MHQRRAQCLTKLGKFAEAKNAFNTAVGALDLVPKLSPEKKESLIRDIMALMAESESAAALPRPENLEDQLEAPTVPSYGSNPFLPGASTILEVKTSPSRGRHVIAQKTVKVGDVLFSELPYASILLPEHYSTHCHHCVSVVFRVFESFIRFLVTCEPFLNRFKVYTR